MTTLTLGKALNAGLRNALEDNPKVLIMGEDVGKLGGVFRITDGLQKDFGEERVIDTPLAESGIIGTAVGLAIRGYRPVCEIQFDGFVYPAYNQIVSQVAKMHYRSGGKLSLPAHTAGLKVVSCANPEDAYFMIQQAIATDDPVVFFEPKRRYWDKGEVDTSMSHSDAYPLFASKVIRPGTDATVVAYGPMTRTALDAATAASQEGRELEVIDLRSLSPLDLGPVFESVRRTGRLIVVHEAARSGGLGGEIAARVTEECFYSLEAPVLRVTGFDIPYPAARAEDEFLPDLDRVLDAVDKAFGW
jgi:pyruvate dehydrogenase E1 component beta subunit